MEHCTFRGLNYYIIARKMRCKWLFHNKPNENFSETPAFRVKSNWNPPKGHSAT